MKIIMRKVSEITPYENNPRRNDEAVDKVAASIKEFGFQLWHKGRGIEYWKKVIEKMESKMLKDESRKEASTCHEECTPTASRT